MYSGIHALVDAMEEEHPSGCCFHIVLADGNTSERHIRFCMAYAIAGSCRWCMPIAEALECLPPAEWLAALGWQRWKW